MGTGKGKIPERNGSIGAKATWEPRKSVLGRFGRMRENHDWRTEKTKERLYLKGGGWTMTSGLEHAEPASLKAGERVGKIWLRRKRNPTPLARHKRKIRRKPWMRRRFG